MAYTLDLPSLTCWARISYRDRMDDSCGDCLLMRAVAPSRLLSWYTSKGTSPMFLLAYILCLIRSKCRCVSAIWRVISSNPRWRHLSSALKHHIRCH